MSPDEVDKTWEHATRLATFALLIFAVTTFAASVFLPLLVQPMFKPPAPPPRTPMTPATPGPTTPGSMSAEGYFTYHSNLSTALSLSQRRKRSTMSRYCSRLPSLRIPGLTLRRTWIGSHLLFAFAMFATFAVRTTQGATVLIAFLGIPWALTNWAPFALIAAEISKRDAIRRHRIRPPPTTDGQLLASGEDPAEGADQAGVVLGIHNVAIAAPQVIATLVSSAIFKALQKPRGTPGDDSVAWVLRFGGVAALIAAYLSTKIEDSEVEGEESEGFVGGH